jgi:hypothetical protein
LEPPEEEELKVLQELKVLLQIQEHRAQQELLVV